MPKKTRAEILKNKKERVGYILKLIRNGIYNKYDLMEKLKKKDWYNEVTKITIYNYLREAKNIAKSRVSTDFILNSSFIFDELREMYINAQKNGDEFTRLKVLQEMAKVQGLYDSDLKKQLLYKKDLEESINNENNKITIKHSASKEEIAKRLDNEDF